jgi:hypothetical protein
MQTARNAVRLCARASVTGVAFFDFNHGQTGVAPNAIELHPVLRFRCLSRQSVTQLEDQKGRAFRRGRSGTRVLARGCYARDQLQGGQARAVNSRPQR